MLSNVSQVNSHMHNLSFNNCFDFVKDSIVMVHEKKILTINHVLIAVHIDKKKK